MRTDTVSLRDIYEAINSLEEKMDKRVVRIETKTDVLENKLDNLVGKVGIVVMLATVVVSAAVSFVFNNLKNIFKQ